MNLGQWLGQWAGQWFGALEELPPGFMRGSATLRVSAAGDLTAETVPEAPPAFVFGVRPRINRTRENDEALLVMLGMI